LDKKLFGTDGIRGTVNESYLTADTALKLGLLLEKYLQEARIFIALL